MSVKEKSANCKTKLLTENVHASFSCNYIQNSLKSWLASVTIFSEGLVVSPGLWVS